MFEGVHSHVKNLLRKTDFGPLNFSSKFMITWSNPILVHFSIVRITDFGQDSYLESKLDQNGKIEQLKIRLKSELDTRVHVIINFVEKLSRPKSDFRSKSITWD